MQSPIFLSLVISLVVHTAFGYLLEHMKLAPAERPAVRKPEPLKMFESKIVQRSKPQPQTVRHEVPPPRPDYETKPVQLDPVTVEEPPLDLKSADSAEPITPAPVRSMITPDVSFVEVKRVPMQEIEPEEPADLPAVDTPVTEASTPANNKGVVNPPPAYPALARGMGYEGVVVLLVKVAADGTVLTATVKESSGHSTLDQAALEGVLKWKFNPATQNGKPVEGTVEVPVRFLLQ